MLSHSVCKRKFLVSGGDLDNIKSLLKDYRGRSCELFFKKIGECKTIWYERDEKSFTLKVITPTRIKVIDITEKEYKKNLKVKNIYYLKYSYFFSEGVRLIVYHDKQEGVNILELKGDNHVGDFIKFVQEDITTAKKFTKPYLALFSNPLKTVNIYEVFKKYNNKKGVNLKDIIKNDMNIDDAVRIIIYKLYVKLIQDRLNILNSNEIHLVDFYRKRIVDIISLLKIYKDLFEKDLVETVIKNLYYLKKNTDALCELNAITRDMNIYKNSMKEAEYRKFLSIKDADITEKIEKFNSFLHTEEHSIILKQLELLIKESSNIEDKDLVRQRVDNNFIDKLRKRYKKLDKAFERYIDCEDKESFEKILSKVEKLEIANKNCYFIDEKNFYKREKSIKALKQNIENILFVMINIDIVNSLENKIKIKKLLKEFYKSLEEYIASFKDTIKQFSKRKEFL